MDLKPTGISIQLADCSIRQLAGILEDVPLQVGKFRILCDFFVLDTDDDLSVALILGRPFLATAGAVIDVPTGTMSFTICGERVDFYFPSPTPLSTPAASQSLLFPVLPRLCPESS